MRRPRLLVTAALLLAAGCAGPRRSPLDQGATFTRWLLEGDTHELWDRLTPGMRDAVGGRDGLERWSREVAAQLGPQDEVLDERARRSADGWVYTRVARFRDSPAGSITIQWQWDDSDAIRAGVVRPTAAAVASPYETYTTRTRLRLPFAGAWRVAAGGRALEDNHHASAKDQRFGYDFVLERDGAAHDGSGARNEDWHCWGEPVLAPAAGAVVAALDTLADNAAGTRNRAAPVGNHLVIDHGGGEFSVLAHLRRGSLRVRSGDRVGRGTAVAECGNSGNSATPHLHYHLQAGPEPRAAAGLPAIFEEYVADGVEVARGEPRKGQRVQAVSSR